VDPQKAITVFLSEFDYQVDQISSIYHQLESKLASVGEKTLSMETVESIGYWLHNLYCAYEDLFKMVAGFWENNLTSDGRYHINLLKRMILEIKDVRPPLLSKESHNALNELRSFRHIFRHAYSYGLDDERVLHLV
jgi:HepT-like protein